MNYLKTIGLAALAAMAMMAVTAGTASATTLEINGVAQNKAVTLTASLLPETSLTLKTTNESTFVFNTCTASHAQALTSSPFTGESVAAAVSVLSFSGCTGSQVTVDSPGRLSFKRIVGTTNATVFWDNTEVTYKWSLIYEVARCKTGTGTDVGSLKGLASGHATLDIDVVLSCGFALPSVRWQASYVITTPTGLGAVS